MSWISKSKFYEKEKWWCFSCEKHTKVKLNPDWINAGKPYEWDDKIIDFEWFAKCSECDWDHLSGGSYSCPDCGWNPPEDDGEYYKAGFFKRLFDKTIKKKYPQYGSTYVGHEGDQNWEEIHYCPHCKEEFSFMNGT